MIVQATGKMSTFGGPDDTGVGPREGLALIEPVDLSEWWFRRVFLRAFNNSLGLARNLDPQALYCAMRWNEHGIDRETARRSLFRLTANGKSIFVQGVDYGPGDGKIVDGEPDPDTGRLIDLSPGAALALNLDTDDLVTVDQIWPAASGAPGVQVSGPAAPGGKGAA